MAPGKWNKPHLNRRHLFLNPNSPIKRTPGSSLLRASGDLGSDEVVLALQLQLCQGLARRTRAMGSHWSALQRARKAVAAFFVVPMARKTEAGRVDVAKP